MNTRQRVLALRFLLSLPAVVLLPLWGQGFAVSDGIHPPGIAEGSPAGTYPLSGFDTVNLFNGAVNFRLPLREIRGRGEARYTMTLHLETHWQSVPYGIDAYDVIPVWQDAAPAGYGPGRLSRKNIDYEQLCGPSTVVLGSYTIFTLMMPDGTALDFHPKPPNDQPYSGGTCTSVPTNCPTACSDPIMCPLAHFPCRGQEFVTRDGSAATFWSNNPVIDLDYSAGPVNGFIMFRDGVRYTIADGRVGQIRDRNGNLLTFTYETLAPFRMTQATDSLGRTTSIASTSR